MTDLYEKLFDCATSWMLSDGGDGFSLVICRSKPAKEVADHYEKWQTIGLERTDHNNGSISFDNDEAFVQDFVQEQGICFMDGVAVDDYSNLRRYLMDLEADYKMGSYIFVI